jgi:phosphohistidine phosphatase
LKTILLMRHAEAQFEQGDQTDFDRTLTPDGEKMASQTGALLKAHGMNICRILASAASRTLHTAQLVAAQACPTAPLVPLSELYACSTERLVSTLFRHCCSDEDSILLVAHNPGVSGLMCRWANHDLSVQPATLLAFTADTDDWDAFRRIPSQVALFIRDAQVQPPLDDA